MPVGGLLLEDDHRRPVVRRRDGGRGARAAKAHDHEVGFFEIGNTHADPPWSESTDLPATCPNVTAGPSVPPPPG